MTDPNQTLGPNEVFVDDDRHTQEAYKRNKGKLIDENPYSDLEEFPDESSLFIGDLSRTVTEEMLLKIFSQCGPVDGVDIKRDKVTKNNLGYGFVKFKDRQQAERAKIKMNGYEIGGRAIRIGWAQKNTNLFVCLVGDMEERITGEHLRVIFHDFGPIYEEDTFVKRNKYGFVKFKHRAHAEKAKAALDGKHLILQNGYKTAKPVRIGWGDANTQRNCVHVQFEQNSASQVDLKEEDFKEQFQRFGIVNKVSLPRYSDKRLKGYGFIHFEENDEGEESAARAITELTASQIKGVVIMCNFGKRQNQRHKRFAQKKQAQEQGPFNDGMGGYGDGNNMGGYGDGNQNNMGNNMGGYGDGMNNNQNNMGMGHGMGNNMGDMNNNNQNFGMNNNMGGMNNNNMGMGMNNMGMNNNNINNMPMGMNNMNDQGMNNMGGMNNNMQMGPPNGMNNNMNIGPNMGMNNNMDMQNQLMGNMPPPMMGNMPNMPPPGNMNMNMNMNMGPPMMNNNMGPPMPMGMGPPPPPNNMMGGPPLSGPNPFMMGPPGGPNNINPNLNPNINPMMMRPNNQPNITVGQLPQNPMINLQNGVPPSPPPPNQMPLPPSNFKINNKPLDNNQQDNQAQNNIQNDQDNNQPPNQNTPNNPINKFQLPFNNLPSAFPAPPAPQLNMTQSGGGTGPNTPNRIGPAPPLMPTFLPLGGMNNPMFGTLGGGIPQLSPQMKPNSQSTSPQLVPQLASPPNLFVPPFPAANPPPPHLGHMKAFPNNIPSPNLANLQGFNPNIPPRSSPSPPVSPFMTGGGLNPGPGIHPFIPSPQMLQLGNPSMPPINLNKPPMTNLTNTFNTMHITGVHKPLIMQNVNPMLNQNPPQPQGNPPNQQ